MKLLDLFCGEGGAAMGYHQAGFEEITGIDHHPMKRYPFDFVRADAMEYLAEHGHEYDLIHASPPCQAYSIAAKRMVNQGKVYPDLIEETRRGLRKTGKPYVIENVPGAPLISPVMLCGSMFGLGVLRHRLFEINPEILIMVPPCRHGSVMPMWWNKRREELKKGKVYEYITVAGRSFLMSEAKEAMGIDWMTRVGISQAIPPIYTKFIGKQLVKLLEARECQKILI
jgi:DNA (cytosine-5)-methyltransferase 1